MATRSMARSPDDDFEHAEATNVIATPVARH
jgi:hypothetical protein